MFGKRHQSQTGGAEYPRNLHSTKTAIYKALGEPSGMTPLGGRLESDTYGVLQAAAMCQRGADPEARPRLCRCGSAQAGHQQHLGGLSCEEVYRFVNLA